MMNSTSLRLLVRPSSYRRTRRSTGLRARRGATAVLLALFAVPIVGVLALAVDVGVFYRERRNLQSAADAAALAWAHERYGHPATGATGANTRLATAAAANGYTHGADGTTISSAVISWGTSSNAIRVTVIDTVSTLFGSVLGVARTVVAATAVATFDLAYATSCVYTLDPDDPKALELFGNGEIRMPGCGVQVNSTASNALYASGNVTLLTGSTGVAGGYDRNGVGGTVSPAPTTGVLQAPNPLASVSAPATPSGCTYPAAVTVAPSAVTSLSPGVYCGRLTIKGTANLAAGAYFLLGGIEVSAGATINGSSIVLINTTRAGVTAGPIEMGGGPTLNLSADTSSTAAMKGIVIYQSPLLTGSAYEAKIRGNNLSTFRGTLYFPNSHLDVSGNTDFTIVGSLIASTLEIGGNGNLTIPTISATSAGFFSVKRVTLVD